MTDNVIWHTDFKARRTREREQIEQVRTILAADESYQALKALIPPGGPEKDTK